MGYLIKKHSRIFDRKMSLNGWDYFKWAVTLILLTFHCLVTYFVLLMRIQKNSTFQSHFFLLYLMMSVSDILTVINNFFLAKFTAVEPWKQWFFEHPIWNSVCYMTSGYLIYIQSFLHIAIAVNRIYVSFSLIHGNKRISMLGRRITWTIPIIPICILFPRFWGHTVYAWTPTGDLTGYYVEPFMKMYHVICGQAIVISASFISFILTVITIGRYRHLLKKYQHEQMSSSMKQDIILFCQGFVTMCFQLSFAAYYIMTMIGSMTNSPDLVTFAWRYFNYVNDAASLCNPIALLIVCKFVRKDFSEFLSGCKPKNLVSPWNTSAAAPTPYISTPQ